MMKRKIDLSDMEGLDAMWLLFITDSLTAVTDMVWDKQSREHFSIQFTTLFHTVTDMCWIFMIRKHSVHNFVSHSDWYVLNLYD